MHRSPERPSQAVHLVKSGGQGEPGTLAEFSQQGEVVRERKVHVFKRQHCLQGLLDRLLGMEAHDRVRDCADWQERASRLRIVAGETEQLARKVILIGHQPVSARPSWSALCTRLPRTSRQSSA